jgi:hypothetical protein
MKIRAYHIKNPEKFNGVEIFQLKIFRLMRDISEVEKQLSSGKNIKHFVNAKPNEVKNLARSLSLAHKNIQKAALQFSEYKPKKKQVSFELLEGKTEN